MARDTSKDQTITLTQPEALVKARALQANMENFRNLQKTLIDKVQRELADLANRAEARQAQLFNDLARLAGLSPDKVINDQRWALDVSNLVEGSVALIYKEDNCDCLSCVSRRAMQDGKSLEEIAAQIQAERLKGSSQLH